MKPHILALGMPGTFEMIVIGGIGLLVFGRRLPEIARSMGKSIIEFKKGLRDVKEEISLPGGENHRSLTADTHAASVDSGTPNAGAEAPVPNGESKKQQPE